MSLQLENMMSLWWLALIPAIALLISLARHDKLERWQKVAQAGLLHTWRPYTSLMYPASLILMLGAMGLMVFALANPQAGTRDTQAFSRNQNVVIALDLSQSMMASDISPNRLERARIFAYDLLEQLQGQRVGLIVFAGNAYIQLPLTTDYAAAALFIRNLSTEMIPTQGTNMAAALERSLSAIQSGSHAGAASAIVLISDGEDHDKGALAAAKKLIREGIVIHAVGAGTQQGAPVPDPGRGEVKRDDAGEVVISKLDEAFLQELARQGKGNYYTTSGGKRDARALASVINKEDSGKAEQSSFAVQREWYQWFLAAALIVLAATFFTKDKARKMKGSVV
jgi:Ca-activated chloride channel homolog